MSVLDKEMKNSTETPEEQTSKELTLEELVSDDAEPFAEIFATLHFELEDILNAIEHHDQQEAEAKEAEKPEETEAIQEAEVEEPETSAEPEPAEESVPLEAEVPEEAELPGEPEAPVESEPDESEAPAGLELAEEPETPETPAEPDEPAEPEPEPATPARKGLFTNLKGQDSGTKKLVVTDIILLLIIVASIVGGLIAANSLVDKANAANQEKIAEMKANIKEVDLSEKLYDHAASVVIDDVAVPTYSLDELYALDLREPTGFTANDLKMITRKGLVGCEEAFVKAEETYGVNSIFLMSIASLESAYGTQMFRPNNMFGYGRTGFSSKQEGIMTVAKGLGTRYLNPSGSLYGGSPTLKGVNKRYAANPQWYYKVGKYMKGYYEELAAEKNGALDKFE